ncbi:MAG: hypothetical protein U0807_08610 [Candidatus Binatia bacterium]
MTKKVLRWIGLVVLLLLFASGKVAYVGLPITATVVAAQTGKPVEGVIVVAIWELYGGNIEGGLIVGQAKVLETVSDANGRFHFPWWGPRVHTPFGELSTGAAPLLLLFAKGYAPTVRTNDDSHVGFLRRSDWNGRTVSMDAAPSDPKAYSRQLLTFDVGLHSLFQGSCDWRRVPRMLLALDREAEMLRAQGSNLDPGLSLRSRDAVRSGWCGSIEQYVREHAR